MNRERSLSTSSVQAKSSTRRHELPLLIALGVPLLLLAACGSGQSTSGSGGAAGSAAGTGGKGSGGSGASGGKGGGGSGGVGSGGNGGSGGQGGGGGAIGKGGAGGSSSGGVGGGGSGGGAGAGGHGGVGSGGAGGGAAGAGGGAGSAGSAGSAGMTGAGGGSSCASATNGATCTSEGATCGGPCTDICQFCNTLRCTSGHWQMMEAFPAPCFTCGDGKCQTMSQYCKTTEGGPVGSSPSHACVAIPAECQSTRTCACLAQSNVPGTCTMGSNGELMTLLQAP